MRIPEYLNEKVKAYSENKKLKNIFKNREQITKDYKELKNNSDPIKTENDLVSYLLSRLPSTYAVSYNVLEKLNEFEQFKNVSNEIKSIIDIGAGPATSTYACLDLFESIEELTLIERNNFFIEFAKNTLIDNFPSLKANIIKDNIKNINFEKNYDIAIISYVLNELEDNTKLKLINDIWEKTNFLIIIEPGTPRGFESIRKIKNLYKESVLAPCTHNLICPLEENDWCHFYKRIERTKEQKYLKNATESYEDEKFSYLILAKNNLLEREKRSRIIRHPKIMKGHISLKTCSENGVKEETYSAKNNNYKEIKKLSWGDSV
ncbi:MAG: small ribosomal subunit Rsm22 family protein [Candidatus Sericytochromatia bacterium]